MLERPCPICRKPVSWASNPSRPFCSKRCKTQDLGAWSAESYRMEATATAEGDEEWNEGTLPADGI